MGSNFWDGFEKRALHPGWLVGGAGLALGGLGVAKAMQPYDVTSRFVDISADPHDPGNKAPVHMEISKKRPLFFGRKEHMAQAAKPAMTGLFMGSPVHNMTTAGLMAKQQGGKLRYTPKYREDFLRAQGKDPFLLVNGAPVGQEGASQIYDRLSGMAGRGR